jgi:DNA polymerase-3 subunit epsilon
MSIPKEFQGDVLSFDTETAVLGDHICEIGFSLFRNGELQYEWGTLIKPIVAFDPESCKVHNIYDKDVVDSPTFKDIAWHIYNILNSADIHLAYNYGYDRGVLENEYKRLQMQLPVKPMVDPFIFFKQYHKYNKGKTLIKAAEKYGIEYVGAHRAVNDATIAGKVLFKMAATKNNFPKNLPILIKKQRQWVEYQYKDLCNYFAKVGKPEPDKPNYSYFEL